MKVGATRKLLAPHSGAGARSHIVVPMLKDNELIGAISIYRQEVRPFADRQIELLTSFVTQPPLGSHWYSRLRTDANTRI
jgi:GAF domain-containing protein